MSRSLRPGSGVARNSLPILCGGLGFAEGIVRGSGTEGVVVKGSIRDHHHVFDNDSAGAVVSKGMLDFGPAVGSHE